MKSKTKISTHARRKTNLELVKTINECKKNKGWLEIASMLTKPKRIWPNKNLNEIDDNSKDGETVLIPGKVLSQGEISKKVKIIALKFSKSAEEKLLKSKTDFSYINEEIKKNPSAKGIRILK